LIPTPTTNLTNRSAPRGMTLVDLLLALGILAVGLSMIATVFPVAAEQTRDALDQSMAVVVARNAEATLRALAVSNDYPVTVANNSATPENTVFLALPETLPTDIGYRIKKLGPSGEPGLNVFALRMADGVNNTAVPVPVGGVYPGPCYYWRAIYARNPLANLTTSPLSGSNRIQLVILVCRTSDNDQYDPTSTLQFYPSGTLATGVPGWNYGEAWGLLKANGSVTYSLGGNLTKDMWYDPNTVYAYRTSIEVLP